MKTWIAMFTAVCFSSLAGAQEKKAANPSKELDAIQGKWRAVKASFTGLDIPADEVARKKLVFEFKGEEMIAIDGLKEESIGKVTIDPSKTPTTIDIKSDKGEFNGIFRMNKGATETIEICLLLSGEKRPTKFESVREKEMSTILLTLERSK